MNLFISLARFVFGVYCILYTFVHILTFVFPLTTNYFLFHNYGKKKRLICLKSIKF